MFEVSEIESNFFYLRLIKFMEPLYNPIVKRIFTEEDSKEILECLKEKAYDL